MIAALIVGAITAWYLGARLGVTAAALTAGALVVATIVPGLTVTVYALVIAWVAALYFFGSKIASEMSGSAGIPSRVLGGIGRVLKWRAKRK